jgi:hypothetical protein
MRDTGSERRDYQMLKVWEVVGRKTKRVPELISKNQHRWLVKAVDSPEDINIGGFRLSFRAGGRVSIQR